MNDIEKKALALLNECGWYGALCRAIEQHEAFRLEVSDALKAAINDPDIGPLKALERFIIADPLEEALRDATCDRSTDDFAEALRAAIAKRGGKIVWENSDA